MMDCMMHERHKKTHNGSQSNNNVRQRAPLQSSMRDSSTPTNQSTILRENSSLNLIPAPPLSTGVPRVSVAGRASTKLFDALAHPAQAAAAAHTGSQPPRGRKRKTFSLVLLTIMCVAVVHYSGNMYDGDFLEDAKARRPSLRSGSPAIGMDYQLATYTRIMKPGAASPSTESSRQQVIRDRIVNAIKAAFVADAASMGTHWIYKANELAVMLLDKDEPEFRNPPVPKFYSTSEYPGHYGPGQASPYGEQLLFVTQYAAKMAEESVTGDEEQANIMEPMSQAMQDWASTFRGRQDEATLEFLACRRKKVQDEIAGENQKQIDDDGDSGEDELTSSCGANDDQAHFFLKIIPMTCLYVGHPHRRYYVEQSIRVHQNNDNAVMLGLALSDLLERVLLMDNTASSAADDAGPQLPDSTPAPKPATSLRDALEMTLESEQDDHSDSWWWTTHHQQQETMLQSWTKARELARSSKSLVQVAADEGTSCHMPGAFIVSLHALYNAANVEAQTTNPPAKETKPSPSHHYMRGYDYYVKSLLGSMTGSPAKEENPLLVTAVRENILAAGDTCSRAILMGAVLGAAYGGPPTEWWEKLYPVLSGQVEEAAYTIADHAARRLQQKTAVYL